MGFKEKSRAAFPEVPPSLRHDSVELNELNKEEARQHADTAPSVTPYLGLRARLSQIWFNRWTVLLILVLVRVVILIANLNDNLADAKVQALSACTKVEDIGSSMASMPHYLSVGVNSLAADGITRAVQGLVDVLMLILTGVQNLIFFVIQLYVGTYACLATALIHGGLDIAVAMVEDTTKFMNNAISGITDTISSDVSSFEKALNDAISGINTLSGGAIDIPTLDIGSQLDDLKGIKVDDTQFVNDLVKINGTIPTFADVKNLTENVIAYPFNLVKEQVNTTYGSYSFDSSIFPVAQKQALTFCSSNSFLNDFFDSLFKIVATAKIAFIVGLSVLAVLVCIPMTMLEIRRWRRQQKLARVFTRNGYDPMDVVYIASRPFTATAGIKLGARFSDKRQLLVRWAVAYATSLPALFVLSLALAGLFSCLCQFIILAAMQKEAPALASQVGDFAAEVVTTLDNVSVTWANDANGVILGTQDDINKELFGWVNTSTTAVNDTLNKFDEEITSAISAVFNGSVLENTIQNLVGCLLTSKIEMVEKGLTWVHDNAHVTFPTFPNDTFSQGAAKSIDGDSDLTTFLSSPSSVTTDEITGAVDHVTNALRNNIIQEALTSAGLLLVYVIVVLIGIIRSLSGMAMPSKTRGEGGQRYVTADQYNANAMSGSLTGDGRAPLSPRTQQQFKSESGPSDLAEPEETYFAPEKTRKVRSGKGGPLSPGHWRQSSHGQIDDAGKW